MNPTQLAAYHAGEAERHYNAAQSWRKMGSKLNDLAWMQFHVKVALRVIALEGRPLTRKEARRLLRIADTKWP